MLSSLLQAQEDMAWRQRTLASSAASSLRSMGAITSFLPFSAPYLRRAEAAMQVLAGSCLTHNRPDWGIRSVQIEGSDVAVVEAVAAATPFGILRHFTKPGFRWQCPVLLLTPMSGHFSTLLRNTVEVMLPDYDVFVTDWTNARDVPAEAGPFGLDEFIDHIIQFARVGGGFPHIIAVCQPAPAALAAMAVLAEDHKIGPSSLTLVGGPIDTRVSPTEVNKLAASKPLRWFEDHLLSDVPSHHAGKGRQVYPGAIQLQAFMSMNLGRHLKAHEAQYHRIVKEDLVGASAHRSFYAEYLAVMDLHGPFFLDTIQRIFQDHDLACGRMTYRGRVVDPGSIRNMTLITVEGGRDDICGLGQTSAAHRLCTGLEADEHVHVVHPDVGHYGLFSGSRWSGTVYPRLRQDLEDAIRF